MMWFFSTLATTPKGLPRIKFCNVYFKIWHEELIVIEIQFEASDNILRYSKTFLKIKKEKVRLAYEMESANRVNSRAGWVL